MIYIPITALAVERDTTMSSLLPVSMHNETMFRCYDYQILVDQFYKGIDHASKYQPTDEALIIIMYNILI